MTPDVVWDEAGASTLTELAKEIAAMRAAQDEATLARLVADGKVVRASSKSRAEVKFREMAKPRVNLAIRPKKRRRR